MNSGITNVGNKSVSNLFKFADVTDHSYVTHGTRLLNIIGSGCFEGIAEYISSQLAII